MGLYHLSKPWRRLVSRGKVTNVEKEDRVSHSTKMPSYGKILFKVFSKGKKVANSQQDLNEQPLSKNPTDQDQLIGYSPSSDESPKALPTQSSRSDPSNEQLPQLMATSLEVPGTHSSSTLSVVLPKKTDGQNTIRKVTDVEPSTSYIEDQDKDKEDGWDQAGPKSAKDREWEEVFRNQENKHANELADLRKDLEAEIKAVKKAHKEAMDTADSAKAMLQRRVNALTQAEVTFNNDLETKDSIVQHVTNTCQGLQRELSQLKTDHEALLDQKHLADSLQEENVELLGVISSMEAKEQTRLPGFSSPSQIEDMEHQLQDALKSKAILAKGLSDAQRQSLYFERRAHQLNKALQQSPNEVTNIRGVIELKDRMFSDLEGKASECFAALIALKENSSKDRQLAEKEIISLKAKLDHSQTCISTLESSRNLFQRHWEDVYSMLQGKILQTDFNKAMSNYYQLAIDENSYLKAEVRRQARQISCNDLRIVSLEATVHDIEKLLQAKEKTEDELRHAICSQDTEIWRLEIHVDNLTLDKQDICNAKDYQIADLSERLRNGYNAARGMVEPSRDERERSLIREKEHEIEALQEKCRDMMENNDDLYRQLNVQEEACAGNAEDAYLYEATAVEYKAKFAAAEAHIHNLQERLRDASQTKESKGKGKEREDIAQDWTVSAAPRALVFHGWGPDYPADEVADPCEEDDFTESSKAVFEQGLAEVEAKYGIRLMRDAQGKTHVEVLPEPESSY